MKSYSKRVMTAILAVIMLLSVIVPIYASAAEVTMDLSKAIISRDHTLGDKEGNIFRAGYGLKKEDNPYGYQIKPVVKEMHDYTAKSPDAPENRDDWVYGKHYVYCFCIEPGVFMPDFKNYSASTSESHGNKYEKLSDEQKNLLSLALAYGYPNRTDMKTSKDANACYSATQLIVWQITLGFRTSPTELNDKTYPMEGYSGTMTEQFTSNKYLKEFYDAILSDMATHYTRPSFTSDVPAAAKTYEMDYVNGKYTVTLTDTNNVLSKYTVTTKGGASVSISGNELTVSSTEPLTDAITIKLNRRMPSTFFTTGFLIWTVVGSEDNNQDMVSGVPANNDPVPSYLKVATASGSVTIVKESEDGVVDGIEFNVTGNGVDQTVTTANGGVFQINDLRPGTYTVTELTEDKYEEQAPQTVTVTSGQTATVTFSNKLKRGDLEIIKTSEDGKVDNILFTVTGNGVNESVRTDESGKIQIDGLLPGTYTVTEQIESYYEPQPSQTVTVAYGQTASVTFRNVLKRGDLIVTKTAEDGLEEGVRFRLTGTSDSGTKVDVTATVDSTGKAYFRDILVGSGYVLEEVDTAIRYEVPDNQEVEIRWAEVTAQDVDNILKRGSLKVIKTSEDNFVEGVKFHLFGTSLSGEKVDVYATTDSNGIAVFEDILIGNNYTLEEVDTAERYIIPDSQTTEIQWNKVTQKDFHNTLKRGDLKVIKTSEDDFVEGVKFHLYGTALSSEKVDEYAVTDSNGIAVFKDILIGENYTIEEVDTAVRYVVPEDQTGAIRWNEVTEISFHNVLKENEPQKGSISVSKSGEVFSSVVEHEGIYQPMYEIQGLAGAVYEIRATEDVITPEGTLRYSKDEVVATITTAEDGTAASEPLFLGKYTIQEITAPNGMVINGDIVTVELTYAGQEIQITTTSAAFVNERQKAEISLEKVMEQDEKYEIGLGDEILSVQFGLFAMEDIIAADGTMIPKDGLIETVFCDENGKVAFATDLPVGAKVYVKELTADDHYLVSDSIHPVIFEYAGQEVALVEIPINEGKPIHNEIIRGSIIGKKLDEDGFTICGAVFGLFRENETVFTEETALAVAKSNENGVFGFEGVPYGRWIVHEIQPAPAFVVNESSSAVTVGEDEEIIEIIIENDFITGSVTTTKVDAEYPDNKLTGAVFEIYVDVDGNGEFNAEIDKLVGEMTETDAGIYVMNDLRYNGYFLYEKVAPEGFLKDEGYHYFEIRNDGETVTVENEAGVGFINQPSTGELELTKKDVSTDKVLANVGFRIRNEAGEVVTEGYTDENGIAKFTLRQGKYTYQEFAPLEGYILDKTEYPFEIKENGEIVKAVMTNKPTPGIPQTGDDSNIGFWIGLAAIALGGLIATVIIVIKQKKDDE